MRTPSPVTVTVGSKCEISVLSEVDSIVYCYLDIPHNAFEETVV